ncbi:MAG: hypothetical protein JW913_01335 [Chitinispirillaceae bacterium]|nr:hypothetical protein [Chitinispirillaceae bacterium]
MPPACFLLFLSCKYEVTYHPLPAPFIYTIIGHNDSLFFSTPSGEIFSISPENPDVITRFGMNRFHPIRGLAFKKNGDLFAASYQTGVHRVLADTLIALPRMWRMAWSMKLDGYDNIWLAGRQGVFRQRGDTLIKFTGLHEAYDVDFHLGKCAVAHRDGITIYDTADGTAITTFCKNTVCWSIDIDGSLLIGTGSEVCVLVSPGDTTIIPIGPEKNIPWTAARDRNGTIYLGTQKGLFRIKPGARKAKCIGFKGKCIKSLFIDRKGRLWVGKYFK